VKARIHRLAGALVAAAVLFPRAASPASTFQGDDPRAPLSERLLTVLQVAVAFEGSPPFDRARVNSLQDQVARRVFATPQAEPFRSLVKLLGVGSYGDLARKAAREAGFPAVLVISKIEIEVGETRHEMMFRAGVAARVGWQPVTAKAKARLYEMVASRQAIDEWDCVIVRLVRPNSYSTRRKPPASLVRELSSEIVASAATSTIGRQLLRTLTGAHEEIAAHAATVEEEEAVLWWRLAEVAISERSGEPLHSALTNALHARLAAKADRLAARATPDAKDRCSWCGGEIGAAGRTPCPDVRELSSLGSLATSLGLVKTAPSPKDFPEGWPMRSP
jgi:hypothetical protein